MGTHARSLHSAAPRSIGSLGTCEIGTPAGGVLAGLSFHGLMCIPFQWCSPCQGAGWVGRAVVAEVWGIPSFRCLFLHFLVVFLRTLAWWLVRVLWFPLLERGLGICSFADANVLGP